MIAKNYPIFGKVAKIVAKVRNAKISTLKLNLKVQNIVFRLKIPFIEMFYSYKNVSICFSKK
jgi:hypothetical protein